ncbi:MAG: methyltransferase domain-containing protein [Flavobacteriaceae bacterium]|nr:methyltransferase domain-containing protein [Flavobacteriaceae bacterium]
MKDINKPVRLHKNLAVAVINCLDSIFNQGLQADKVIAKMLKSDKRWGKRDRGFIAENTYEIIRWKRLYGELAGVKEPFSNTSLWRLLSVRLVLQGIPLPAWDEVRGTPARRIKGKYDGLQQHRAIVCSITDWLDKLGVANFGETQWKRELDALNTQASVVLRVNRLQTNPKMLQNELVAEGIQTVLHRTYPDALILQERANVFETDAFKRGLFEVQDASSQLVASFTEVSPGMQVIDACAGAGGKSLHLAALMENKGQLTALDIYPHKLHELKRRAKRAGVHNITTRHIQSTKVIKKLHGRADRVLIDAPCTGLGVLRRNPDAKWKIDADFLERVKQTQKHIIHSYATMVKPGGKLVYATCSILKEENQNQVEGFLQSEIGKQFTLEKEQVVNPAKSGFDGFYMARMIRS